MQHASISSSAYARHPHKGDAHNCLGRDVGCLTAGCHTLPCAISTRAGFEFCCCFFFFSMSFFLTLKNNVAKNGSNPLPSFSLSSLFLLIFTRRAFCTLFSPLVLCHRCTAKSAERADSWPVTFHFFYLLESFTLSFIKSPDVMRNSQPLQHYLSVCRLSVNFANKFKLFLLDLLFR